MKRLGEYGSGIAELIITLLGVVIICATGWYVWRAKENAVNSLHNAQVVDMAKVSALAPASAKVVGYLSIKELGIKVPLTDVTRDAYYATTKLEGGTYYTLSTHSLDAYVGCQATATNAGVASIGSFVAGQSDGVVGNYAEAYPKAPTIQGKQYYIQVKKSTHECTNGHASGLYGQVLAAFNAAYPGIVAE